MQDSKSPAAVDKREGLKAELEFGEISWYVVKSEKSKTLEIARHTYFSNHAVRTVRFKGCDRDLYRVLKVFKIEPNESNDPNEPNEPVVVTTTINRSLHHCHQYSDNPIAESSPSPQR